jgi:hypothetical protein
MTVVSTPACSNSIAAVCRKTWGDTRLVRVLVGYGEQGVDFRPRQVMHLLMGATSSGNREHALDAFGVLG